METNYEPPSEFIEINEQRELAGKQLHVTSIKHQGKKPGVEAPTNEDSLVATSFSLTLRGRA